MSNRESRHRLRLLPRGRERQAEGRASLAIPTIVVVVTAALIVGFILTASNRRDPALGAWDDLGVPIITAQPFATQPIPYPDVPRITLQEAVDQQERGEAILLDVRSQLSYEKAHVAGARWLPEDEIESYLDELPRDRLLVLYCT